MAAKSLLTPKVHKDLVDVIRAGNYWVAAADFAHVGRSTLYDWVARGRNAWTEAEEADRVVWSEDPETGESVVLDYGCDEGDLPYVKLYLDLQKAEAEAEIRLVTHWATAARTDWRAAKELLARRYGARWRDQAIDVNITGEISGTQEVTVAVSGPAIHNDDVRTAAVLAILEEAGALPEGTVSAATIETDDDIADAEIVDEDQEGA